MQIRVHTFPSKSQYSLCLIPQKLILDTPHSQVVFTIPKMLRIFFKFNHALLSALCACGKEALIKYLKAATEKDITPGIIALICFDLRGSL
ncbi:MAG: hypothetical protein J7L72_05630 [Candidatus Aminicenantes bacterium]|nr:hypothetical protein [Candidatus Aminicenantes bacterium]